MVWLARTASATAQRELAQRLADARAAEYRAVIDEARQLAGQTVDPRTLQRLRRELRRINRRDYFPPPERQEAKVAVGALAAQRTHAVKR
jgi:hypothetical protein